NGGGRCRDESGFLLPLMRSLGQRKVCAPTASSWSCMGTEIYKVEPRKMPRYSRVSYHQKGTRTQVSCQTTRRARTTESHCNGLPICVSAVQTRTSHTPWGTWQAARSGEPVRSVDDRPSHILQPLRSLTFLQKWKE